MRELKDYDYDPDFPFQSGGRFYDADEVDAIIAGLKGENRKLKRALWLARAERAKEMCKRLLIQGFDPKWEEVERKCRAKAEDITR